MVNVLKLNVSSVNRSYQSSPRRIELPLTSELPSYTERLRRLYKVLAGAPNYDAERSGLTRLLETGCQFFSTEYALLIRRLSHQVAEVVAVVDAVDGGETFYIGQHLHIENTTSAGVFDTNETQRFRNEPSVGVYANGFAYNNVAVNTYLGSTVSPSNVEPMVICFFSSAPKSADFSSEDVETIELLAEGVACMIDLQKAQAQRKMTDQAMFALGSVKTLDEYLQQARLPEVYGVPARVVEVLQRRIGHAPLSIGHIAEELNLSKRTLQRRLQQQDISFAELRDQVRFHYSIDYLIKQHLSIDSISASLDFSDRTSFTNAFKRWTGLSPSAFRKLFRDYV